MANTIYKTLKKLGYEKDVNAYGRKGVSIWYRYDRNGNPVRHLFVDNGDISMYGSSTEVLLTRMTVEEFMDLAA